MSPNFNGNFQNLLKQLTTFRCFIFNQVVRYSSFEKTSKILNIPTFKLHKYINDIEAIFQEPLILKNHRKIVLTQKGAQFAHFCRKTLDAFEKKRIDIPERQDDLIIASFYGFAEQYLPEIIFDFSKTFPNTKLYLYSGVEYFDFDRYDLDILINNVKYEDEDYESTLLINIHQLLYAEENYLKKHSPIISKEDIQQHKFVLFSGFTDLYKLIYPNSTPSIQSTSMKLIANLALHGLGLTILPNNFLKNNLLNGRNLIGALNNHRLGNDSIYLTNRKSTSKEKYIKWIIDNLKKRIRHE